MRKLLFILLMMFHVSGAYAASALLHGGWQHTSNSNYGDGFEAVARVETPIYDPLLSVGIEYAYHGATDHQANDEESYGDFTGHSVLGELILYAPKEWALRPYILGGLGWSWWSFDRSEDLESRGIEVELGDAFSKKVAVGVDYAINSSWSLNFEFSYFQAHVPKDSFYESDGSFANVITDEDTIGQEEMDLMAGLKYSW